MSKEKKADKKEKDLSKKSKAVAGSALSGKDAVHLPVMLEVTFIFARLLIVLVMAVEIVLAFLAGAPPLVILLRAGVSVLVVGLMLWAISWILAGGSLQLESNENEGKTGEMDQQPAQSTLEMKA
ncbi:MAG: hypothetical protein M1281_03130 [Chloroflexi bacterium]|nr:hypothetical protein [Chloroflexota bacterium]